MTAFTMTGRKQAIRRLFKLSFMCFPTADIPRQAISVASDVVPQDTNADGRAVYLPLSADDGIWAKALLSAPERLASGVIKVRKAFGIELTVDKLNRIYLRK